MAKIGILTFSNTLNYGAALQCYALFTYLRNLGNEVSVIDYRNNRVEITGKRRLKSIKSFKEFLLWIMTKKNFSIRERLFDEFNKNYLVMTEQVDKDDFDIKSAQFDAIIVGSDQVWSPYSPDVNWTFFLKFASTKKRVAYAPSMATDNIPQKKKILYRWYMRGFDAISVREKQSKELLKEFVSVSIETLIDPTLMFDSDLWRSYIFSSI